MEEHVFTLNDLKTKFDVVDVTTVIQCNGNRREDFHYLDGEREREREREREFFFFLNIEIEIKIDGGQSVR